MTRDFPFSPDPETRIGDALDAALEALRLARRELAGTGSDPACWRWVALGLVSALQAALIAALSGYVSARVEEVTDPAQPGRAAPVTLLLRRARSPAYLNPPERLDLSGADLRRLDTLMAMRNAAVHGQRLVLPPDPGKAAFTALGVIRHLVLTHPAFEMTGFDPVLTRIGTELTELGAALAHD